MEGLQSDISGLSGKMQALTDQIKMAGEDFQRQIADFLKVSVSVPGTILAVGICCDDMSCMCNMTSYICVDTMLHGYVNIMHYACIDMTYYACVSVTYCGCVEITYYVLYVCVDMMYYIFDDVTHSGCVNKTLSMC